MKRNYHLLIGVLFALTLVTACKKDEEEKTDREVTTLDATDITMNSAIIHGQYSSATESIIIEKGFYWSQQPGPDINDSIIQINSLESFEASLENLDASTTYYYRAFVTDDKGTWQGEVKSFTTLEGPVMEFKNGQGYTYQDESFMVDDLVTIGVKGHSNGAPLSRFKLTLAAFFPIEIVDTTFNSSSFEKDFTFLLSTAGEAELIFELYDNTGMKVEKTITLSVLEERPVIRHSGVTLGSWNDASGSFYSTSENTVYTIDECSASINTQGTIDFVFFKGSVNSNTLAAPDDPDASTIPVFNLSNWVIKNDTRFNEIDMTAAEFDAIGSTYLFPEFNYSLETTKINNLSVGQVYLFQTASWQVGLIKIVDLYSRGDLITFDVILKD